MKMANLCIRNFLLHNNVTCFQKQPPLFLKVSQVPQENTYDGGLFHVCFSLYPIIHVNYIKSYCLHKHFYGISESDL